MNIHVRRIQLEPHKGRGDIEFIFFETGQFAKPLFILNQFDLERLLSEIDAQQPEEDA